MEYYPDYHQYGLRKPAAERIPFEPRVPLLPGQVPYMRFEVAYFQTIKHVKFTTLLKRTTHDDPLVRKDAFLGIQDYVRVGACMTGDSDKDKEREKAMFKKICKGITDTNDGVREAVCELLALVTGRRNFEDYVASLLLPAVMKALAHTEMGVHLTGSKAYDLIVRQLPSCFHLFLRKAMKTLQSMMKNDVCEQHDSHLHMLRIFQTVNVCLSSMPSSGCCEILFDRRSLGVLKSVFSAFPMDSEHFDMNLEMTKIFLRLPKLSDSEKFLVFINDKLHKITESNLEERLAFFPPYVPMLVTGLGSHSQANLIQAFTLGFKRSRPESAFKSACAASIEQMLSGSFVHDVNSELFELCKREWIEELSTFLGPETRYISYSSQMLKKRLPLVMSILRSGVDAATSKML